MPKKKKIQPITVPTAYGDTVYVDLPVDSEIRVIKLLFNEAIDCLKHSGGRLERLEFVAGEPNALGTCYGIGFRLDAIPKKG